MGKPKEQEKIVITPKDIPDKTDEKQKQKIKDEFADREKKPKEDEKIIIKPVVLPTKPEESSSEEEEEEVKPEPKKKLSRSDLKPAVQIKMAVTPEPAPTLRRKKKETEEEPADPFAGLPAAKPKVKDEFAEKDKKPKEQEKIVITPKDIPDKTDEKQKQKNQRRIC